MFPLVLSGLFAQAFALQGQSVEWEIIEPDLTAVADPGNCSVQSVRGHGGFFYAWICLSREPWDAVYRSPDGVNWELVVEGTRVTAGFALEDGRTLLYRKADPEIVIGAGSEWTLTDLSGLEGAERSSVYSVAQSPNGRIVLGGIQTVRRVPQPCWWVSHDGGASFTFHPAEGSFPFGSEAGLVDLSYGNGVFVGAGVPGESWVSVDGETWARSALPDVSDPDGGELPVIKAIRFYDGAFWAAGNYARVYRSSNGLDWTVLSEGDENAVLEDFLIDGDHLHVTGPERPQAWSPDRGETWFSGETDKFGFTVLTGGRGLAFSRGLFAPTGGELSTANEIVFDLFPAARAFSQMAYTEGKWFALIAGTYYLGRSAGHFLDQAVSDDGVYYQHPWFGWFTLRTGNWFFHFNLGWIYSESASGDSVWIYADGLEWILTSSSLWPNFYHPPSGHWGLYADFSDWFYNLNTGTWEERPAFGGG